MCSTNPNTVLVPYGLKVPTNSSAPFLPFGSNVSQMALELQRAQFYDYSARLQYGLRGYQNSLGLNPYHGHPGTDPYMHPYLYKDPRARYIHEEPKPNHSYIGLIAMAILSHRDKKLVLSDIYQWILDNYPYFRTRGPGWRNSIRHNLSLNDCFIKSGRSANGKGHYWAIHPANVEDFEKGDFRRRRAQRRVRKHMGLSVPDDEDSPVPSPTAPPMAWDENENINVDIDVDEKVNEYTESVKNDIAITQNDDHTKSMSVIQSTSPLNLQCKSKKRLFDVESLLAPDSDYESSFKRRKFTPGMVSNMSTASERLTFANRAPKPEVLKLRLKDESEQNSEPEENGSDAESLNSSKESFLDKENEGEIEQVGQDILRSSVSSAKCSMLEQDVAPWKQALRGYSVIASRPSAFHNARLCSWTSLSPYLSSYQSMVGMKGHFPLTVPRNNASIDSANKWQETVTKLVNKQEENSDEN